MKRILIFYGSYGGGHLSAARSIKEYIDSNYTNCDTFLVDCIEYVNKVLNKVSTKAYKDIAKTAPWAWGKIYYSADDGSLSKFSNITNKVMANKLFTLIKEIQPDLIISTHPFSSQMCTILKKKGKLSCKIATIMTDYGPHSQWFQNPDFLDYLFVAHDGMKEKIVEEGVSSSIIHVTGIPLSNKFLMSYDKEKSLKDFGLLSNKTTVLFFAGGELGLGKNKTYKILVSLIKHFPDFQVVAISGRNDKMKKKFEELVETTKKEDNVKVLSYTNRVPELMSVSDLVITKPGGLTTTESLASGLPIVVINPIPGQEEDNAEFLVDNKVAVWIKDDDNIDSVLTDLFNDKDRLKKMKLNARMLAKEHSTKDICTILINDLFS